MITQQNYQDQIEAAKLAINNDPIKAIEAVFRVRDKSGALLDYKVAEPHKEVIRCGLLGDKSALFRVIVKGRQEGFSTLLAIENLAIAQCLPLTYQYYVAAKEKQAKSWLRKVKQIAKDSRISFDGSRLIDIDTKRTTELEVVLKHAPIGLRKEIDNSYICGLSASPGGIRGETSINVTLDEFAWMIWRINLQDDVYESVKYFVATGGQLTVQSTPLVKTDKFWHIYTHAEENMMRAFYFPSITNWQDLDLTRDLREQNPIIPYPWLSLDSLEKSRREDIETFKQEVLGIPTDVLYRYITPELLYAHVDSIEEMYGRSDGMYKLSIDVAQERDVTAITVGEKDVNGHVWERKIDETQGTLEEQYELIKNYSLAFKPTEIGIDNTGMGRFLGDMIESHIGAKLRRFEYASNIELDDTKLRIPVFLATEYKKALEAGRYHCLDDKNANAHVLRVEKTQNASGGIHFSGKKYGRDDHFWSKSQLNAMFLDGINNRSPIFTTSKAIFSQLTNDIKRTIIRQPKIRGFVGW